MLQTAEVFVQRSPQGFFAHELSDALHVEVHDALRQLTDNGRHRRTEVGKLYLYTAFDSYTHRHQLRMRETSAIVPLAADTSALQVSPHELQAAIVLFYSLLDERILAAIVLDSSSVTVRDRNRSSVYPSIVT
ncbi:MAG: hypothetical protein J2P21_18560 [Chloracidobacterium sp.]|nr:hypothetical protein [Chloracidobacterium sp.]